MKGDIIGGPHAKEFTETLHQLVDEGKKQIIVDLGKVKFMNSSGIGILISGYTTLKNAGGELAICRADKKIKDLLVVTQLITVFDHYQTLDEAVDSFQDEQEG
jgi:anti-sigma B factor antagonist